MKTELIEKLREKANCLKYNIGIIHSNPQLILEESFISGVKYGQSSPKIKQLEWTDHLRHYFVDTPFGVYLILRNHKFEENESWTLYFNSYVIDGCIDSDKAQEVAQADFEKRVMECLDL